MKGQLKGQLKTVSAYLERTNSIPREKQYQMLDHKIQEILQKLAHEDIDLIRFEITIDQQFDAYDIRAWGTTGNEKT